MMENGKLWTLTLVAILYEEQSSNGNEWHKAKKQLYSSGNIKIDQYVDQAIILALQI